LIQAKAWRTADHENRSHETTFDPGATTLDTPFAQAPEHRPAGHLHLSPDAVYVFDARGIAKRFRHAAIFGALDALHPGETMRFANDHDPLPLLQQLTARYGDALRIQYRQREPGAIVIDFARLR
jgi:uncharacterized protein (DUF2249 family)